MYNEKGIPFEKAYNFRDMGGHTSHDGRSMNQGILYRSDELSRLSKTDLVNFHTLNLRVVIDLRTPNERKTKLDRLPPDSDIRIISIPIYPKRDDPNRLKKKLWFVTGKFKDFDFEEFTRTFYNKIAFEHTAQIGEIINLLSNTEILPALIHCSGGKDRTGFISACIQLLAGVPRETVMNSYLLTNTLFKPHLNRYIRYFRWMTFFQLTTEQIRPVFEARREYLEDTLDAVFEKYGSIDNYLIEACGVTKETISGLRRLLFA